MIALDLEQGSVAWLLARLGVPSASCFSKFITPTGKPSTSAHGYGLQLIAEYLCGEPPESFESSWMTRGVELEPQARAFYELTADAEVVQTGFVLRDDRKAGCSPDGLVGNDGLLEIKCPAPHTHVEYLLSNKLPNTYKPQVQGQLYICEREWCHFLSFHPLMDPVIIRVERDDTYIKALETELDKLLDWMDEQKSDLAKRDIKPTEQTHE